MILNKVTTEIEKLKIADGNYNCGEAGCCKTDPKDPREKEDFLWQIGYNDAISDVLAKIQSVVSRDALKTITNLSEDTD